MDFTLSEEQEMLRTSARDFLEDRCPKSHLREMEADEKGYSPELWHDMASLGWMGLAFPETHGGSGMTFLDLSVLLEEMGRACLPGPFFASVVLGGLTIMAAGSNEQKQRYLPDIASGDTIFSLALTETDPAYEPAAIAATAAADGGTYAISGTKLFVPDAHVADHLLCVARTGDASAGDSPSADGTTVFVVDTGSGGISLTRLHTVSGERLFEVAFEDVRVPAGNVIGEPGKGWEVVGPIIRRAAVAKACDLLGGIQRVLEMTLDYAKERRQFDRPIGSFQVIQHDCVRMATDVDATRYVTYEAAWALSEGLPCSAEVAVAKALAGEAYERVVTQSHQIHGAIGCTVDHDLQFYTKRGKAAQLSYGDGDFHRETIAVSMGL